MTRKTFNPDMLVVARESRGMTQTELARAANFSQGIVSKWETRVTEPTEESVEAVAEALDFPPSFFFQPEPYFGLPPTFYRKRSTTRKKVLNQLHARMTLVRLHLIRLLRSVALEAPLDLPHLDLDEVGSPEEAARLLRASWFVRPGPIPDLVELIERAGVVMVPLDLGGEKVDAVGWNPPDVPPLIFFNPGAPPDRVRFTIAHELGHLVMHRIPTEDIESEANRFAAEFLLPAVDIRPHLRNLSLERLAKLKLVWRVSMAALLYRAKDLGQISERQARSYWMRFGKLGWRKVEPGSDQIPVESPDLLHEVIRTHLEDLGYSIAELSRAINSSAADVRELYGIGGGSLELVE